MGKYLHLKDEAVAHHLSNPKNSISESAREFCKLNDVEYSDSFRKRLSEWVNELKLIGVQVDLDRLAEGDFHFSNETLTATNQYKTEKGLSTLPSAWDADLNRFLTVEEFCDRYGLESSSVRSAKLVTHNQGHMTYNIAFNSLLDETGESIDEKIEKMIVNYRVPQLELPSSYSPDTQIVELVFTDLHISMEPDETGKSLYGASWTKNDVLERRDVMLKSLSGVLKSVGEDVIINVINLGDFCDGLDGFTVRREHRLPQNLSNAETFNLGVEFLTSIYSYIHENFKCKSIIWYNVCNSNHSADFDYFVMQAFKGIIESRENKIPTQIINERKFIGHIQQGKHVNILSHAKDSGTMKFGFKATVDPKSKEKIEQYIKFHNLDNSLDLQFYKGDTHLYVVDKTEDFGYNSFLALSPSSEYVQTNFKPGRSGFTIIVKDLNSFKTTRHEYEFNWNSNTLK